MAGYLNGHTEIFRVALSSMSKLQQLPVQPPVTSDRIKSLLSRALTHPADLTPNEIQEMAAAVVFHLLKEKAAQE